MSLVSSQCQNVELRWRPKVSTILPLIVMVYLCQDVSAGDQFSSHFNFDSLPFLHSLDHPYARMMSSIEKASTCQDPNVQIAGKCLECTESNGLSLVTSEGDADNNAETQSCCVEICGDGRRIGLTACDDGNKQNGDGCNSSCEIEPGWSCEGGGSNSKDICQKTVSVQYQLHIHSENSLKIIFTEAMQSTVSLNDDDVAIKIDDNDVAWSIAQMVFEPQALTIEIKFKSRLYGDEKLTFHFLNPSKFKSTTGLQVVSDKRTVSINSDDFLSSFERRLAQWLGLFFSICVITVSAIALCIAIWIECPSVSIWILFDGLQIVYYLPLINARTPANLTLFLKAFSFTVAGFLPPPPTSWVSSENRDLWSKSITRFGLETTHFVRNAWGVLLIFLSALFFWTMLALLNRGMKRKNSVVTKLLKRMRYGIFLRLGLQLYLPLILAAIIQVADPSFDHVGNGLSTFLGYLGMTFTVVYPIAIVYLLQHTKTLHRVNDIFKQRWGVLYESLKTSMENQFHFHPLFLSCRLFFAIILLAMTHTAVGQVVLVLVIWLSFTAYLLWSRPLQLKTDSFALSMTNVCVLVIIAFYLLLVQSGDNISIEVKNGLAWVQISLLIVMICGNLKHIVSSIVKKVKSKNSEKPVLRNDPGLRRNASTPWDEFKKQYSKTSMKANSTKELAHSKSMSKKNLRYLKPLPKKTVIQNVIEEEEVEPETKKITKGRRISEHTPQVQVFSRDHSVSSLKSYLTIPGQLELNRSSRSINDDSEMVKFNSEEHENSAADPQLSP